MRSMRTILTYSERRSRPNTTALKGFGKISVDIEVGLVHEFSKNITNFAVTYLPGYCISLVGALGFLWFVSTSTPYNLYNQTY